MELSLVLLTFHNVFSAFHKIGNNHDNCDICHGNNHIAKTSILPISNVKHVTLYRNRCIKHSTQRIEVFIIIFIYI